MTHSFRLETIELDLPPFVGAFSRRLRDAGLPVAPARTADFARALTLVEPVSRRRLYWTARGVFVTDPAQLKAFDEVFAAVFEQRRDHQQAEPDTTEPDPDTRNSTLETQPGTTERGLPAPTASAGNAGDRVPEAELPLLLASDNERLAGKSFDALDPAELVQIYRLMSGLRVATPLRRTRRHVKSRHGTHIDLRRTLRGSLRSGGDPVHLRHRRRRISRRRLVMLCDISGSMEPYARAYLQFLASAAGSGPDAEAFVFATRLTRLTRALASRNPERAIQRAAAAAPDWSSGTRIGNALKTFNDRHGRRGMARGAVIVILSDGWERDEPHLVAREMERLSRLAHRIVWVNPRVGATQFAPQAGGMAAALPYCDALVSGHTFEALREVVEAIGGSAVGSPQSADPGSDDDWASATPVPGSSVAMPSGYGPSRGKTTPGWIYE